MTRRSLAGPLVKSLVFVVVTALATTALAFSIANTGVGPTDGYSARFTDVTGLVEGDSVRVAGVKVGEVESIELSGRRYARVEFTVREGRELPASVNASVKYLNMVGQRYIDLEQGEGPVGRSLAPGGTIPLERTRPALDLTELFNGFQPLFQGLSPRDTNQLANEIVQVLQGQGGTVDSLVETVGSLTSTLAAKDQVIGEVIDNLTEVVETVNTREKEFNDLLVTLQDLVSGFSDDRKPLFRAVDAMGELTATTAGLVRDGRAPLKEDIHQAGRVAGRLADNVPLVEEFLEQTPVKMATLGRLASYGSWFNLYLCEARVTGVSMSDGSEPPTGITVQPPRCER
ncbi:MCE family protein [Streptomyces sp. NBC_01808]|uniref:MCE family protein n=1 Tax=Streptomyces sp. NBC_01808 TaxID=2975947 RepID=UPI002DDBDEB9|nr:MCE family protein [Streptomyces sp. NBC_01808]WSA38329.1 MCE family protein [Streptomyces sp. NBC_01808]